MGAKTTKTTTPNPQPKGLARRRIPVRLAFHARSVQVAVPVMELIDGGLARLMAARIGTTGRRSTSGISSGIPATEGQNAAKKEEGKKNGK